MPCRHGNKINLKSGLKFDACNKEWRDIPLAAIGMERHTFGGHWHGETYPWWPLAWRDIPLAAIGMERHTPWWPLAWRDIPLGGHWHRTRRL